MICKKCGAPIPKGRKVCPYCGASWTAVSQENHPEEETSFAETDTEKFFGGEEDATEFAPVGAMVTPPEEETVFAQAAPARPRVAHPGYDSPAPAPKRGKRKKQSTRNPKKKKQTQKAQGPNQVLRLALVAVLAVLIVLLILR